MQLGGAGGITVVFDGREGEPGTSRSRGGGAVRVVFSKPPESADQCIQKLIETARASGRAGAPAVAWRVVSSDREVAGRARLWGARVTSVEGFLAEVGGGARPRGRRDRPPPMSGQELAEWERLFRRRNDGGESEGGGEVG
jgi:hypothetical protein